MQPVFRLLKYQRPWRVDHVVGDFIAAMRRQAVQEDGIAFGLAEQSRIDLIRKENMLSLLRFGFLPHAGPDIRIDRSEEHTSELQSLRHLVCRLLLEKNT